MFLKDGGIREKSTCQVREEPGILCNAMAGEAEEKLRFSLSAPTCGAQPIEKVRYRDVPMAKMSPAVQGSAMEQRPPHGGSKDCKTADGYLRRFEDCDFVNRWTCGPPPCQDAVCASHAAGRAG